MIAKAGSEALRNVFRAHLEETHGHLTRLDRVFGMLDVAPKGVPCPAIEGILDEAADVASEVADEKVLDAALAAAAQAVEHYEIARYGTLIAWARRLRREDVAELLEQTLAEERGADARLTEVAEQRLNTKAA